MKKNPQKSQIDIEWENRQLCSDGNCIGVIGPDGLCKECGKPSDKSIDNTFDSTDTLSVEEEYENHCEDHTAESATRTADTDTEWENRQLCSDGACIGVIGPDGMCKECGRALEENGDF